nr:hypothetical protein [Cedecea sp. NFIX57]
MSDIVRGVDGTAVGTVQGTGVDTGREGDEFAFREAGNVCVTGNPGVDKPENAFFIPVVNEERNIKVSTTVDGVIKCIEAKDGRLPAGILIVMKSNYITGQVGMTYKGFTFTGRSAVGHIIVSQSVWVLRL